MASNEMSKKNQIFRAKQTIKKYAQAYTQIDK